MGLSRLDGAQSLALTCRTLGASVGPATNTGELRPEMSFLASAGIVRTRSRPQDPAIRHVPLPPRLPPLAVLLCAGTITRWLPLGSR